MTSIPCKKVYLIVLASLILLSSSSFGWAAEFFVDNSRGDDANAGTYERPWKSLNKANNTLRAGDTVFIRGGTYRGQQIKPANSGRSAERIIYKNYEDEIPLITDSDTPMDLNNRSHITISGIKIRNCDKYLVMTNGNYNILEYLDISSMRNFDKFRGFNIGANSSYNWIHHCKISKYGDFTDSLKMRGDMIYIGAANPGNNSHNLIENNTIFHGAHNVFAINTPYNVVRNNYFHNEAWYKVGDKKYSHRVAELRKSTDNRDGDGAWNLIEGNRFGFTDRTMYAAEFIKVISPDNIFRRNLFYKAKGPAIRLVTFDQVNPAPYADNNYIFHNVIFNNGFGEGVDSANRTGLFFRGDAGAIKNTVIKNNIFSENYDDITYTLSGSLGDQVIASNWLEADGDPNFVDADASKINDPFDSQYPNFELKKESGCIDNGVFLTSITSDSGSGTAFRVKDAHYFIDGWGMEFMGVHGDLIQLEGRTEKVRIVDINYDTNVITIDESISWSKNQGVSLAYSGSAPDIGAIEAGEESKGYSLYPPTNLSIID